MSYDNSDHTLDFKRHFPWIWGKTASETPFHPSFFNRWSVKQTLNLQNDHGQPHKIQLNIIRVFCFFCLASTGTLFPSNVAVNIVMNLSQLMDNMLKHCERKIFSLSKHPSLSVKNYLFKINPNLFCGSSKLINSSIFVKWSEEDVIIVILLQYKVKLFSLWNI